MPEKDQAMTEQQIQPNPAQKPSTWTISIGMFIGITLAVAALVFVVTALLMNIFTRKVEAKNPYVRLVEVNEETTDPEPWGTNWSREYDAYKQTAEHSQTKFGGSESMPDQKAKAHPWLTRMF